jgi:hypothetical protein
MTKMTTYLAAIATVGIVTVTLAGKSQAKARPNSDGPVNRMHSNSAAVRFPTCRGSPHA